MKLVDSSVISEPVEFIFNLLNVVLTKHFLFSYMKLSNYSEHPVHICMCICVYEYIYIYI